MGYSSSEPSFPDNFMEFDERQHRNFLELPLQAQEEQILDVHLKAGESGASEFFSAQHAGTAGLFPLVRLRHRGSPHDCLLEGAAASAGTAGAMPARRLV